MKQNVFVFPCGSEIGLEIYKSLDCSTHFKIFGGSSIDDHGKFVYKNYIPDIPMVDDANFIKTLNEVLQKHKIDYIFPAHDSVVLKLAQEEAQGNIKCKVITSPLNTCEIARSKLKTYEALKDTIRTPLVLDANDLQNSDLPVFLKPDIGQGSKGTYLVRNIEDIDFYIKKDPSLIILEYLPGKEFTIDCFTNKKGELIFCEGRERSRISNGISVNSKIIKDKRFNEIGTKINKKLDINGVWFFQLKEDENKELVLMEIAPRVAGTMALNRCRGVNLPLLSLFDAIGTNVDIIENEYYIEIDRALSNQYKIDISYNHVYLDFDDMVVFEGKLNVKVMEFVFQCINMNIKVYIITKHKKDIIATMKDYRLQNTFDKIIKLEAGAEKYKYIKEKDAIFIDDSFAERKKVHDKCGIPVFDSHMIEGLMK